MRKIGLVLTITLLAASCKVTHKCDAYGSLKNSEKDLAINK